MPSVAQLSVFLPAALLVAISPGANNLLALRNGMRIGLRGAAVALAGRVAGFAVMLALAAAGVASVLVSSQTAFTALKWAGVAYLAFLGLRGLLARPQVGPARAPTARLGPARQELLTVASNPKALLLFTAFLPQFLDTSRPVAAQLLVLGPVYMAIEVLAACGWAYAGQRLGAADLTGRARRRLERGFGAVFLAMAGLLATAER